MSGPGYRWIDDVEGLEEVAGALAASSWHVLDTESNSGFAYEERLCLLQLNVDGAIWLLDLLALPGGRRALDPLRPRLESAEVSTCLHGGEFDVACLKRDHGISLGGVWDTQQAASLLGWEKTGYASLVERVLGRELDKGYTLYDWSSRPLEEAALRYAVEDVAYLPGVARHLRREVERQDLQEEVAIACRAVEEATWSGGFEAGAIWKVKGVRRLPAEALPVLTALHHWRDRVARERDRPPGRLLNDRLLVALSRRPPRRPADLQRLGVPGRLRGELGRELLAEVERARREPPPVPPRPRSEPPDPRTRSRGKRLRAWRKEEAERRGVPLQVVLPARALEHLERHGAEDLGSVPQLGDKRRRLYGETLRRLVSASGEGG